MVSRLQRRAKTMAQWPMWPKWALFLLVALGYIGQKSFLGKASFHKIIAKCCPILVLVWICKAHARTNDVAPNVTKGLLMSMIGDGFLVYADDGSEMMFLLGATAFGMAHMFYLRALWRLAKWHQAKVIHCLAMGAVSLALLVVGHVVCKPRIPSQKVAAAIVVYTTLIGSMFWSATHGFFTTEPSLTTSAALAGSAFFVISDTTLILVMYASLMDLEAGQFWVMSTYYTAQAALTYFAVTSLDA